MHAAGHQTGEVRHIHKQIGADLVGDFAEGREVPKPGIGASPGDDQLGPVFTRQLRDLLHVQPLILAPHAVEYRLEPFSAHVHRRAVSEMPARGQIQAHDGVARIEQGQKHRLVHLAAGIGLNIRETGPEQLLGALDGQVLDDVDVFAAAIIALAGVALGIFVGQDRALGLKHSLGHDVFRGDQLDLVLLATKFFFDGGKHLRISAIQAGPEKCILLGCGGALAKTWSWPFVRDHRTGDGLLRPLSLTAHAPVNPSAAQVRHLPREPDRNRSVG